MPLHTLNNQASFSLRNMEPGVSIHSVLGLFTGPRNSLLVFEVFNVSYKLGLKNQVQTG